MSDFITMSSSSLIHSFVISNLLNSFKCVYLSYYDHQLFYSFFIFSNPVKLLCVFSLFIHYFH